MAPCQVKQNKTGLKQQLSEGYRKEPGMTFRSKPEIRTVFHVLGEVGYQSNGSNLTARTRKSEIE